MAPELLNPRKFGLRNGRVSEQADIYAFGMVVYEVLTGCPPFGVEGLRPAEIISHVMTGRRPRKPEKAGDIGFGGGTWELVQQCWDQDRDKRPAVEKIRKHFRRVAGTSTVVLPGPTVSFREAEHQTASEPDSGSRSFSQYLLCLTFPVPNLTSCNTSSPTIRPSISDTRKHGSTGQVCRRSHNRWWQRPLYVFCA